VVVAGGDDGYGRAGPWPTSLTALALELADTFLLLCDQHRLGALTDDALLVRLLVLATAASKQQREGEARLRSAVRLTDKGLTAAICGGDRVILLTSDRLEFPTLMRRSGFRGVAAPTAATGPIADDTSLPVRSLTSVCVMKASAW